MRLSKNAKITMNSHEVMIIKIKIMYVIKTYIKYTHTHTPFVRGVLKMLTEQVQTTTTDPIGPVLLNPGDDETVLLFTLMPFKMYYMNIV